MQPVVTFEDSRRLTGYNLYFATAGAVLETVGAAPEVEQLRAWQARVQALRALLGWAEGVVCWRLHASGASLALAAPFDQLFTATEVNEWAWLSGLPAHAREAFHAPGHAAAWDPDSARATLQKFSAGERQPRLMALLDAATARGLTTLIDDATLSLGSGTGVRCWSLAELPDVAAIDWDALHDVPIALVTGSNGKTTSVRLLAALLRAQGREVGYSCTDGLFVAGDALAAGDYSGPAGARAVLRERRVEAAVLETARGGILRRGIAVQHAGVALVSNVSVDHFGEYGIHDLEALAEVKLVVARALGNAGLLVLNADDALLVRQSAALAVRKAWFALDHAHPRLLAQRQAGGSTCGVNEGRLLLHADGVTHDLGAVAAMPLSFAGKARYNIANIAGAVLAAHALGCSSAVMVEVLQRFGATHIDNPGRLQHWQFGTLEVFLDYAHNVEGLRGLLEVATRGRRGGHLRLVLGQAGNREDREIRELAEAAAAFAPRLVVLKDIDGMLRGRAAGEVAAIMRRELVGAGVAAADIVECLDEVAAARHTLQSAQPGDVLVLPIHASAARRALVAWLDALHARGWLPGEALPAP